MTSLAEGSIGAGTELAYIAGLAVSGLLLIILAAIGINNPGTGARVGGGLVGVAMLGYGAYLFFGDPEHIWVFWYVFVVPIALVVQLFKSRRTATTTQTTPVYPGQQPYQNPPGYPVPAAGPQAQQPYQAYLNPVPQYQAPQNPTPPYPAPQYQAPQYQAPQYPTPQYPAPQNPVWQDPDRPNPT